MPQVKTRRGGERSGSGAGAPRPIVGPLSAAVLAAMLSAPAAAGEGAAPAAPSAIDWTACAVPQLPTRQCGHLAVPLDYDRPDGPAITIALARVAASDPAARIGSLILNPGGPGGPGVAALALMHGALPDPLPARFDVVSFDPRGIGESTAVRCFGSVEEQQAFFADYPTVPVGPAAQEARAIKAADLARRCADRAGDLLAHLSTANVARDMDRIREALGDDRLTYLGASYGTFLGATYANLFPDRIRAMALDGVIDPASFLDAGHGVGGVRGPATNSMLRIASDQGSLLALGEFIARCVAAGPARCAFAGDDVAATRARLDALMAGLHAKAAASEGAGPEEVSYSVAVEETRGALYAAQRFAGLAEGLAALEKGDGRAFLAATKGLETAHPADYQNVVEALLANNCGEADQPRTPEGFEAMTEAAEAHTPYFGAAWAFLLQACTVWTARDEDRYVGPWNRERSAPILIVSRLYDPATPHASAQAAAATLGDAHLLTIDGWGHSYFEGGVSTCANNYVAAYLADGVLPPAGTVCSEDAAPFGGR